MKKLIELFAQLFTISIFAICAIAQNTDKNWMRVQNETGEISIEIPKSYSYFFDKDGFEVAHERQNYRWRNAHFINAYTENTLISIESYEARKEGLASYTEEEKKQKILSEIENQGVKIKQSVIKKEDYYLVRQYFYSGKYIYILTAASRKGETPAMKQFLSSLKFNSDKKVPINRTIPTFNSLKPIQIEVKVAKNIEKKKDQPTEQNAEKNKDDKGKQKMIVMSKPRASYIDNARMKNIQGELEMRLTFSENGFFPKIEIVRSLPEGLARQCVFAALRIKFLPALENEKPVTIERTLIYDFSMY